MIETIRKELQEAADPSYKEFHQSLVPGLTSMLGVRMPRLREIARTAAREDWKNIWNQLQETCYEELMLKGLLIGYGRLNRDEQTAYLKIFIPQIDNWAICDCCCSIWKFMRKEQDYWFDFLQSYLFSEQEYQIRFGLVSLLEHFVHETYLNQIFALLGQIPQEGYYVKMAVAWLISVCYVKFPSETWEYLKQDPLDDFTHNKAIQKIRESYRVSPEEKKCLLKLKRKETTPKKEQIRI